MIAAGALAVLSVALGVVVVRNRPEPPRVVKSSILPPDKGGFEIQGGPMAVSPDGARIAFIAVDAQGKRQLWVRPLSGLSAQPLQGTDDAGYPFWSPDSRFVAFFSGGKLKKIDPSGGPPESICDAPIGRGGSWAADGTIVFAPTNVGAIFRVKAS